MTQAEQVAAVETAESARAKVRVHQLSDSVDPRIAARLVRETFEELFNVPPMSEDKRVSVHSR